MEHRPIARGLAAEIYDLLIEECGAPERYRQDFVDSVTDVTEPCHEYRFQGALGFGGKFRNNGNHDNTPYVDCYPEDENPARRGMMDRANTRLAGLLASRD